MTYIVFYSFFWIHSWNSTYFHPTSYTPATTSTMLVLALLTLLTLLTTALARPTAELANVRLPPHPPSPSRSRSRSNTWAQVYVCEHVNWEGKCVNIPYAIGSGDCISLDGTASSIRPDKGFSCTFYKCVFPSFSHPHCPAYLSAAALIQSRFHKRWKCNGTDAW